MMHSSEKAISVNCRKASIAQSTGCTIIQTFDSIHLVGSRGFLGKRSKFIARGYHLKIFSRLDINSLVSSTKSFREWT